MNKIRELREQAGITQRELALACGWGAKQSRISNYELGLRSPTINEGREIVAGLIVHGVDCSFDHVFPPQTNKKAS
jgi:putative transcriptional regulator